MSDTGPASRSVPLRGWKEIAAHLGTSQRSAQRYASDLEMPVHRRGTRGASVAAYAHELDEWVRRQTPAALTPERDEDAVDATSTSEITPNEPAARSRAGRLLLFSIGAILIALIGWWSHGILSSRQASARATSIVKIGLRLNGREMQIGVTPGTAASVVVREGRSLWLTPTCEGDDLRIALREGSTGTPASPLEIGSVVLRSGGEGPSPTVLFAYDDWTLELWWSPLAQTSPR